GAPGQYGTSQVTRWNTIPPTDAGYKPHLHFGVRTGRMVEEGAALVQMRDAIGNEASVTIAEVGEPETEVNVAEGLSIHSRSRHYLARSPSPDEETSPSSPRESYGSISAQALRSSAIP